MKKLWQKNNIEYNKTLEKFLTGEDLLLDQKLVAFDIYGSLAHGAMLKKISILTAPEYKTIKKHLLGIISLYEKGQFVLQFGDEDVHTKIENYLTEKTGDIGKKIHTGRSRNDQILVDLRLYTKSSMLAIWEESLLLLEVFLDKAQEYGDIPMPGYTHMQKAMPSSVGMWLGAYIEGFLDSLKVFKTAYDLNNQSPLGSGAGYGVPLPLDREYTASLLGFEKVQDNSLYTQNSRGKIESVVVFALLQVMFDISRFASDVLLFTTSEFDYFSVSDEVTSGSSIMPQKKNVDIAELLRSKIHVLEGNLLQIIGITSNLPSGYNRDLQDMKKPYMESLELTKDSIEIAKLLLQSITPKKDNLLKAMTSELYATQVAYELVQSGMPFRDAYLKVGKNLSNIDTASFRKNKTNNPSIGSVINAQLEKDVKVIKKEKEIQQHEKSHYKEVIKKLKTL